MARVSGDVITWTAELEGGGTTSGTVTVGGDGFYVITDNNPNTSFTSIEMSVSGSIKIGLGGNTVTPPPSDVVLDYEMTLTDGDGDTATETVTVYVEADGDPSTTLPPIVLDLDGDGLEFAALSDDPIFDVDGDGSLDIYTVNTLNTTGYTLFPVMNPVWISYFQQIGQCVFAIFIAFCSGCLARFLYVTRSARDDS